ncbi:MAG: ferritin-like domain-containing protein [Pseudomonadota bacterium]|nr:ferritin-like domain-containing protein [Pseudomonadota bacterium]
MSSRLRTHLLATLGVTMSAGCWSPCVSEAKMTTDDTELCLPADTGDADTAGSCPSATDALSMLAADSFACTVVSVHGEGTGADCCYPVTVECHDFSCCAYGRPYVAEGSVRSAEARPGAGWHPAAPMTPDLRGVSADQRRALAAFWTKNMLSEHSSVAGFHRFALDLLAHGAPLDLLLRAQAAIVEEVQHTRMCAALASAYAGAPIEPGPLPMGVAAPIASSLAELAAMTAKEGCVGETLAAWLAESMLRDATDPAVRHVLTRIARDEARHAAIAWATVRWAIEVGGAPVRAAVAAVFATGPGVPAPGDSAAEPGLVAHGFLPDRRLDQLALDGWREVVMPCIAALGALGGDRAAPWAVREELVCSAVAG